MATTIFFSPSMLNIEVYCSSFLSGVLSDLALLPAVAAATTDDDDEDDDDDDVDVDDEGGECEENEEDEGTELCDPSDDPVPAGDFMFFIFFFFFFYFFGDYSRKTLW